MKKVTSLFAVFVIVNFAIYFQIEAAFATPSLSPSIHSEQKMGFNFAAVGDMGKLSSGISRKISSKQKLYNPMKKVNSLFAVFVIVNCAIYFQIEVCVCNFLFITFNSIGTEDGI